MAHQRPNLWRRLPKFPLMRRLKATGIAVLIALLLVPLLSLAQNTETPPASAPAAVTTPETAPAAPTTMPYLAGGLTEPSADGTGAGVWATPGMDGKADDPNAMTPQDLYHRITHNTFSINMVWVLLTGFLVMFMQFGFAMVETGLIRAKNAGHTYAMNLMVYPLGCLAFYMYGFAIGWGNWFNGPVAPGWYSALGPGTSLLNSGITIGGWGIMGTKGFFLSGVNDVSCMALFFFMMVFMDTTATIPTGAMAERWSWGNFCLYGLWVALPYCLYANWVWGGGWLAQLGVLKGLGHGMVDFAGSGVVHSMGGVLALAGALVIGPRIGKFINGKPQAIPGHDLPMVMGGTFVLAFGWFGFNPGSTLSGTDLRISFVVVNTMLAGIMGCITAMIVMWKRFGKPDPSMMCNGMLAGLVAITAPCAFVSPLASCIIGGVAGVLVVFSVFFWDNRGVDDPVGAISVHGVNGLFGVLCVGLFSTGDYGAGWNGVAGTVTGILPIGAVGKVEWFSAIGWGQLAAQSIGAVTVIVFGFLMGYSWFKLSDLILPIRVSREVELQGLDIPEMGALGYPDFELKTTYSVSGMGDTATVQTSKEIRIPAKV